MYGSAGEDWSYTYYYTAPAQSTLLPVTGLPFTVIADSGQYGDSVDAPGGSLGYVTTFLQSAHNVVISAICYDPNNPPSSGGSATFTQTTDANVLIDPDGYVFDIDQGGEYDDDLGGMFNPVQAISGVTVTAYVSEPTWGGWIPWPAHVYSQTNPQVTDSSYPDGITTTGYYAFYTPPGLYYLQVEGGATTEGSPYQEWRSPVIEVITQPVHVNVPYTPLPESAAVSVTLTAQGISSPVITIPVGSAVQWTAALTATNTITDLIAWDENPILHPKSDLDPLLNPRGFDAGYLEPGRVYRRKFALPGVYAYTDAAGHSGQIIVTGGAEIYLPLVLRNYAP